MEEDTPCWLCEGLKGIAVHIKYTEQRGNKLWTAHKPVSNTHPVYPCPVCAPKNSGKNASN